MWACKHARHTGTWASLLNCMTWVLKTCSHANLPCTGTCSDANILAWLRACSCVNVPCVLTCSCVNVSCVLTCWHPMSYMLTCQCAIYAFVFTCQRALSPYMPHMSTWLACLCTDVSSCLASSYAHVSTYLESLAWHGLCGYVITCQHAFPPQ